MLLPVSGSGPEDAVFVLNYWIYPHPMWGGVFPPVYDSRERGFLFKPPSGRSGPLHHRGIF